MLPAEVQHWPSGMKIRGVGFAYPNGPNQGRLAIGGVDLWEWIRDRFKLHSEPAYLGELEITITIVERPEITR